MGSKEAIIYQALLIVIVVFSLVFLSFVITILKYRKKSSAIYFEKMKSDFSTIENNKKRTATDVHDGLGSYLSAIKLLTDEALEKSQVDEGLKKQIEITFQKTFQSLRNILSSVVPRTLQKEGLQAAIEEQVAILFPRSSPAVNIAVLVNLNNLTDDTLIHIYRIVQELLNNIQKHAEATRVSLSFQRKERFLFIEVRDDGKGFDKAEIEKSATGFGLTNVSSRILFLQGDKYLETAPGKGTSYQILLPVFHN